MACGNTEWLRTDRGELDLHAQRVLLDLVVHLRRGGVLIIGIQHRPGVEDAVGDDLRLGQLAERDPQRVFRGGGQRAVEAKVEGSGRLVHGLGVDGAQDLGWDEVVPCVPWGGVVWGMVIERVASVVKGRGWSQP